MLDVALEREVEGDLVLGDMGQGMPFKAGTYDAAVSISALQWLCNADKTSHVPAKRLLKFFTTLFSSLVNAIYSNIRCMLFTIVIILDAFGESCIPVLSRECPSS